MWRPTRDAERLAPYAPSVQITTGGACHLELPLVERKLPELGAVDFDFLFIEDVGNLICPASHELGEHVRVILLSSPEGDDKPGKYPKAFRTSQVTVISKLDLLPYVPFSVERAMEDVRLVQPAMQFFPLCALSSEGLDAWCAFLGQRAAARNVSRRGSKDMTVTASPCATALKTHGACRIVLQGRVQGLGVRPAIYRLAQQLELMGHVRNTPAGVEIVVEGDEKGRDSFRLRLEAELPRGRAGGSSQRRANACDGLRRVCH